MPQYAFILGTNPALSASEALRMLAHSGLAPRIIHADTQLLCIETKAALPANFLSRLGGTEKIAEILHIQHYEPTAEEVLKLLHPLPPKWRLGISTIDTALEHKKFAIELKKMAREQASKLTFILPRSGRTKLNAAQILFNALHRSPNAEIIIAAMGDRYAVARTVQVQDIPAYEKRDTGKPARDAKVGMLPPKLAQIMLSLAVSELRDIEEPAILDPFCGTGTVLQEGWLAGYKMIGSDSEEDMIEYSGENMQWIHEQFDTPEEKQPELVHHDAGWPFPEHWHGTIDAAVTEPFLGKPLSKPLPVEDFNNYVNPLIGLYRKCFQNLHETLKPGGVVVFLLPAVMVKKGSRTELSPLPQKFIDEIEAIGYRIQQLLPQEVANVYTTEERGSIQYGRPDAIIHREVTLWRKA